MNPREPMQDLEYEHARNEGLEASCPQLLLALACFVVAMLWALTAGAWLRLGRRILGAKASAALNQKSELETRHFSHLQNPS